MNYNYLETDQELRSWKEILILLAAGLAVGTLMAIWLGSRLFITGSEADISSSAVNIVKE